MVETNFQELKFQTRSNLDYRIANYTAKNRIYSSRSIFHKPDPMASESSESAIPSGFTRPYEFPSARTPLIYSFITACSPSIFSLIELKLRIQHIRLETRYNCYTPSCYIQTSDPTIDASIISKITYRIKTKILSRSSRLISTLGGRIIKKSESLYSPRLMLSWPEIQL